MGQLAPLFTILAAAGTVMLLVGIIMLIFPPRNINHIYGYRTKQSMESEENWQFAQTYSAKLMVILGASYVILGFGSSWLELSETLSGIISISMVVLGAVLLILKTESELKKKNKHSRE